MHDLHHIPVSSLNTSHTSLTMASGPVIIQDNKVLVVIHGEDDKYKFPGGKQRMTESMTNNAVRECQEELGLDITVHGDPFILVFDRPTHDGSELVLLFHYKAVMNTQTITPGRDVRSWKWMPIEEIGENCMPNISPAVAHFLRAA